MRGMLIGIGAVAACISWLRWSSSASDIPPRVVIPTTQIDQTTVARRHAAIIAQITKDSPWILNHSEKPSTNS